MQRMLLAIGLATLTLGFTTSRAAAPGPQLEVLPVTASGELDLSAIEGAAPANARLLADGRLKLGAVLTQPTAGGTAAPQLVLSIVDVSGRLRQTIELPVEGEALLPGESRYVSYVLQVPALQPTDRLTLSPLRPAAAEQAGVQRRVAADNTDPIPAVDDDWLDDCRDYCDDRQTDCDST
ncbi:MAG TPA: hypothetical protein VHQ65_04200 [Thermoanaerobaculia bacterium]|nr:hypothetical protein [Thermoanaerobaculia bacterium]